MTESGRLLSGLRRLNAKRGPGAVQRIVSSSALTTLFVLILGLAGASLYIWQRVHARELIDEVAHLEKTNRERRDLLQKTESEVTELGRIGRITKLAGEKFGLQLIPPARLYAVTFHEETAGASGVGELWGALNQSFAKFPRLQTSEATASELFEDGK